MPTGDKMKDLWENPTYYKKMNRGKNKRTLSQWQKTGMREKMIKGMKKAGNIPSEKKRRSERAKKRWREAGKKAWNIPEGEKHHRYIKDRSLVGRAGQNFSKKQRNRLLADHCNWCRTNKRLQLDHILPVSAGGTNEDQNAQTLCLKCNEVKRADDIKKYSHPEKITKRVNTYYAARRKHEEINKKDTILLLDKGEKVFIKVGSRFRRILKHCGFCKKNVLIQPWKRNRSNNFFCNRLCQKRWESKHLRGKHNPFFGKKHSKKTILLLRKKRKGMNLGNKFALGYKHTLEARKKISKATIASWKNLSIRQKGINGLLK